MAKAKSIIFKTPWGKISFPYLSKIDSGRAESSNKYGAELFITLSDLKETPEGSALIEEVMRVAKAFFDDESITLKDFKNPFTVTNSMPENKRTKLNESVRKDNVLLRAKSNDKPTIFGPGGKTDILTTDEQINNIRGGDICRLIVDVFPYKQQGGGVTLGLKAVQFKQKGIAFGRGDNKELVLDCIDEVEVDASDVTGGIVDSQPQDTTSAALNDLIS